jgi:hypothetical protein
MRIMQEIGKKERIGIDSGAAPLPSDAVSSLCLSLWSRRHALAAGGTPFDACCDAVHVMNACLFDDTSFEIEDRFNGERRRSFLEGRSRSRRTLTRLIYGRAPQLTGSPK